MSEQENEMPFDQPHKRSNQYLDRQDREDFEETLDVSQAGKSSEGEPELPDTNSIAFDDSSPSHSTTYDGEIPHQIGLYHIVKLLGEGGMGSVYLAQQNEPVRRQVALKIIKPGLDTREVIARFESERQALAMMDHPGIARVLEAGSTPDRRPYFVMELVSGMPVTEFCDSHRLGIRERLALFVSICNAVHHAHMKGIIHRDLKPSNILATLQDGEPVTKVIDFGLAKAMNSRLTDHSLQTDFGQVLGTLRYMSPEQSKLDNLDIDARSDTYSLGVILYELLTGTTPISRESMQGVGYVEILHRIQEEDARKPSVRLDQSSSAVGELAVRRSSSATRLTSLIKGDLDWIVLKALEKDRRRRYESTFQFGADVQRHIDDEPVEARPPTLAYRTQKFIKKNRSFVVGSAVAAALLLIIAVTIPVLLIQAAVDRERAAEQNRRDSLAANVRMSIARGQWREALDSADELLATQGDFRERDRIELDRIRALNGMGNHGPYREAIEGLSTTSDDPGVTAERLLWRGDLKFMEGDSDAGTKLIRESLDLGGLNEADQAYANALLADDLEKAVELLSAGLRIEPFHQRINIQLFWSLLLSGRIQQANQFVEDACARFPEDPNFSVLKAMGLALDGHSEEARRLLVQVESEFGNQQIAVESYEAALEVFAYWSGAMDDWEEGALEQLVRHNIRLAENWEQRFDQLNASLLSPDAKWIDWKGQFLGTTVMRLPRAWFREYERYAVAMDLIGRNRLEEALEFVDQNGSRDHQGELLFLLGMLLRTNGKLREAEDILVRCAQTPSVLANHSREAWFLASMTAANQFINEGEKPEDIERAVRYANEFSQYKQAGRGYHNDYMARVALRGNDLGLADRLITRLENDPAFTPSQTRPLRVRFYNQAGQHANCIELADDVLAANPNDEATKGYRADSAEQLKALARALDSEE